MTTRQYIGARYIPVFANPVEWSDDTAYEYLTMVQHVGETYMSKQNVPIGAPLPDTSQGEESTEYWVHMSNWNAQVETYRQEVLQYNDRISTVEDDLPTSSFDSTNTVADAIDNVSDMIGTGFDSTNTVADAIDNVSDMIGTGFDSTNTVADAIEELQRITTPYNYSGKRFVFMGDSITIGQSGSGTFYDRPWCKKLCDITGALYKNLAVGGACFQNVNVVTQENFDAQVANAIATDWGGNEPDYIFIMFGTNDYGTNANIGNLNEATANYTTVCGAMKTGINALRVAFPQATVIGVIPPFMPGDVTRNGANFTAMDYKTAIKNMYDILNVPTIDFTAALSVNESNWNNRIWDTTSPRLHPNQDTHDFMGTIAAGMLPSVCNRIYTMLASQNWGGTLELVTGASGQVHWWIDEQNDVHFFTQGGVTTTNGDTGIATVPEYLRPMFDHYIPAIDLNTGNSTYVYLQANGRLALGGANINTHFHMIIPQMIRRTNTGNIR